MTILSQFPRPGRVPGWVPLVMELIEKIEYCQVQFSTIWRIIEGLKQDGISDNDPAFDHLEDKAWMSAWRLEALAVDDPRFKYKFDQEIRMN